MDKDTIVKAAFRAWNADMYMKTSLADLARELGMTKPALYRYFCSKDALLSMMFESAVEDYRSMSEGFGTEFGTMNFRGAVELFAERTFRFYLDHPGYFYFFARFLFQHGHSFHKEVVGLLETDARMLAEMLLEESSCSRYEAERVMAVLFTHLLFWCELTVGMSGAGKSKRADTAAKEFTASLFDGFFPGTDPDEFDAKDIESRITISPEDLPVHNKRLSAVMSVIAREGFAKASVSKIAAELNISKSSLYSFFKNKNEMLHSVFERQREWIEGISREKLSGLVRSHDLLYGFMYILLLSFVQDRRKAVFLNWLRFQNFKPEEHSSGFNFRSAAMIKEIWKSPATTSYGLEDSRFEGCFRVQLVREIMETVDRGADFDAVPDAFRKIYTYLAFGLENTILR